MAVSTKTYEELALEQFDENWELFCGQLRKKPGMTQEHQTTAWWLAHIIGNQLDRKVHQVRDNGSRTRRGDSTYFIPDVLVIPREYMRALGPGGPLETYEEALPFVAEVWSRSTGDYDVDTKFPEYMRRGDLEIWRVDPYGKRVTAWRRQPNGEYSETDYASGTIPILSLPNVVISLAELFEDVS